MPRGKFIVFEGLDGSGKSTQAERMYEYFLSRGISCILEREPTNGTIGAMAREAVKSGAGFTNEALAMLFAADRAEHMVNTVISALEAGVNVICDRFVYSSLAYQSVYLPMEEVASYNHTVLEGRLSGYLPDLTLFIDTPPEECTRRIMASRPFLEMFDGLEYAGKINKQFLYAFGKYDGRMPVEFINGCDSKEQVFARCLDAVLRRLSKSSLENID